MFICIAGMPGSGKGVVTRAAKDLGLPVIVMGDFIRREAARRGLEATPENMNKLAKMLREEQGKDVIARLVLEEADKISSEVIVVDGVRSLEEVNKLQERGRVIIIAVHASPRTRFKRLLERRRPGDPSTWREFIERDMVELGFGLGNVIALADYMIINEGDEEEAYTRALQILGEILDGKDKSGSRGKTYRRREQG
ncbi:MAG: AAA family ATPase [Pyrodictiaceae archaeon]